MKPFQSKRSSEWSDRYNAIDILDIIKKGYPTDEREKARLTDEERCGINHVNRKLREIFSSGAKAIHMAAYVISSIEDMAHKNKDIGYLLASLPGDKSPSAAISELGMMLAELNEHVIDRIEAAMLCTPELFNKEYLNEPLQEYVETFE
nr:MAG TPA: hypothetical protein [Caudoviricetes sp.]